MMLGKTFRTLLGGATLVGLMALTGCGGGLSKTVDVTNGEYYTEEEFKKLSKDQRDAYCASLDAELASLGAAAGDAQGRAGQAQGQLGDIQTEVRNLQSRYDAAKGDVDRVQGDVDYFEGLPKTHTVVNGEFLQKISGYDTIYADPAKWPRIYRANKDKISDPNLIYPNWVLNIPRDWPSAWTVQQDEYLSKIARYWEVYGDSTQWTKIYEANKGKISDPDMIWPGWELTIPRGAGGL